MSQCVKINNSVFEIQSVFYEKLWTKNYQKLVSWLIDELTIPFYWSLGRIIALHSGTDHFVRVVI